MIRYSIGRDALDELLAELRARGYTVIGPRVRDRAIVYAEVESGAEFPEGWTDVQDGGSYRLERRGDAALFGHNVGPNSFKSFLFPATLRLWTARRGNGGLEVHEPREEAPRYAFVGVRACDLHAIGVQDRVFLDGAYVDRDYAARRDGAFIVAVNCAQAGATCFCSSMGTGPRAVRGFDLALTELIDGAGHRFLVEVGSPLGGEVIHEVPHRAATAGDLRAADRVCEQTAAQMGRTLDVTDIRDLLYRNRENPRWDEVADRCLTCGNCTMACPTCFCHGIEDTTDLTGQEATRVREWDSCFTLAHSYVHGGSVHKSAKSRYRQWLTHKFATWIDQFGTSGCVGCGRCITWCPVAIDVTEEIAAIRASEAVDASA